MTNIGFEVSDEGKVIYVEYSGEISCEEFIIDFTKKNTDYATSDPKLYTFGLNGKILNTPKFMYKKLKDLIKSGDVVKFMRKNEIKNNECSNISFKVNNNGRIKCAKYSGDITCEEFIVDYLKKNGDYVTLDVNKYIFRKGGKILNSPRFKNMKLKELIMEYQTVSLWRSPY